MFRLLLGGNADRILARAFIAEGHDLSFQHVTFAEVDKAPAGMVSAYSGADHSDASDQLLVKAAGWRAIRMGLIATLGHGLFSFMDRVDLDSLYIQAIAVDPAHRGRGIGSRLIEHVESMARSRGLATLSLDVADDNSGARRLYERIGFTTVDTSPRVLILPSTRVHRMVRPLD